MPRRLVLTARCANWTLTSFRQGREVSALAVLPLILRLLPRLALLQRRNNLRINPFFLSSRLEGLLDRVVHALHLVDRLLLLDLRR